MKGQAKALIPALIGIIPLLLAGITGYVNRSGEQITDIAETYALTAEQHKRETLAGSVRADADAAANELCNEVIADLALELTYTPAQLVALSNANAKERG